MKSFNLLFGLILVSLNIQAQQGLELKDSTFPGQICHFAVEMPEGYLLCYGMPSEFSYPYTNKMFLLSKDGIEINEIDFLPPGRHRIHYIAPWKNEGEYILDMESPNETTGKFDRCIHIVNQDFNIISKHCFETEEYSNGFAHNIIDGKYVFAYNIGPLANRDIYLVRFDGTDAIEFFPTPNLYMIFPSFVSEFPDSTKYLFFTALGLVTVDKEVDKLRPLNLLGFATHGSIKMLNEDHFVVFGISKRIIAEVGPNEGLYNENILYIVNEKEEVIAADSIGFLAESWDDKGYNYPAYVQSLDFNGEYIFSAANIQMAIPLFTPTIPRKFQVIKHDTLLNRQWRVILGGDVNTMVYGLFATEDGGCLVYGLRKTHGTNPRNYPYVVKLNADGLITSTTPEPEIPDPSVTLYGNPSSHLKFYIQDLDGWKGHIIVSDLAGRPLTTSDVRSGMVEVDTQSWVPGVYIIQIFDSQNRHIHSIKWLKGL